MLVLDRLRTLRPVFERQGRLIRLPGNRAVVYVGDTHGDLEATEKVLGRFPVSDYVVVFLGDTVDRGPESEANLLRILDAKCDAPDAVYLLMGNHEAWAVSPFSPADFWASLDAANAGAIAEGLLRLPLAAWQPSGVFALHGALPAMDTLDTFEAIVPGSDAWREITWGDYRPEGESDAWRAISSRPSFPRETFEDRRRQLGVRLLVRSHQPGLPLWIYNRRCLTLFTSSAYGRVERHVAVLQTGGSELRGADLRVVDIG
jgi:hypothetical protein